MNGGIIELLLSPPIVGWSYTAEFDKLVNEVSLVEISAIRGELRPIRFGLVSHQCQPALEALHTGKLLRPQPDFIDEHFDQSPLAQVHCSRHVANHGLTAGSDQQIERVANSTVAVRAI